MQWFSAMIPTYPEVQKRAQDELDQVVGRDRLPTVEDEKNLPYCHAIIKEVRVLLISRYFPYAFQHQSIKWKAIVFTMGQLSKNAKPEAQLTLTAH